FVVPVNDASNQPFSVTQSAGLSPLSPADPPDSHGIVRGRIVDTDGRPIARSQVRLAFSSGRAVPPIGRAVPPIAARTTWTDPAGVFEFSDVPAGEMRLTASRAGYFPTGQGGAGSSNPLTFTLQPAPIRDRIE